jgi:hypothetical protein
MEDVGMSWRFEDFDAYWTYLTQLAGAIALRIAALPEDDQRAFRRRLEKVVEPYRGNGGYDFPGLAQNTLAT